MARLRERRGQAVVELAVVLPFLVLLLLGLMEFGRVFHALLTVQNAAREGARLGVTGASDGQIEARVRQAAQSLEGSQSPDRLQVAVSPPAAARHVGSDLTVQVKYKFGFVNTWMALVVPPDKRVDGTYFWLGASMTMRM